MMVVVIEYRYGCLDAVRGPFASQQEAVDWVLSFYPDVADSYSAGMDDEDFAALLAEAEVDIREVLDASEPVEEPDPCEEEGHDWEAVDIADGVVGAGAAHVWRIYCTRCDAEGTPEDME